MPFRLFVLLSDLPLYRGGVNFAQMGEAQAVLFQQHLLKTMLEIEDTFFSLAKSYAELGENVVVICDRGAMDPSACAPSAMQ